ncbi:hypothetical protein EV10_0212 [Prochlorococcus marinus str. SS51]|nr:hypothetical protein EV08_0679 [Prochlorococcus marinus str. SS2]KGG23068.1 hypothetical protein EV09_1813 [Prochlorococcus marinus str. SS35]KGG33775.1 hypothetical protein EV10_0212 [Prochlorococcus marinus str. SS51]
MALICFFVIQSCSNSKVGERLANSFEAPVQSQGKDRKKDEPIGDKTSKAKSNKITIAKRASKQKVNLEKKKKPHITKKKLTPSPKRDRSFKPKPYRIIIRLSGANPSAPAEEVTNALRDAGVSFEIEKIESFNKKTVSKDSFSR